MVGKQDFPGRQQLDGQIPVTVFDSICEEIPEDAGQSVFVQTAVNRSVRYGNQRGDAGLFEGKVKSSDALLQNMI